MLTAVGIKGLQLKPISIAVLSLLGSAIDEAVSILTKYGGSLWVADPDYTFTNSDGNGAAGDGSDAGYVRDLCGNARPLTQATTGFKPKLRRVPKRLGVELVTNGDFASATGWSIGSNWAIAGGVASKTAASFTNLSQSAGFTSGKSYVATLSITSMTTAGAGISIRIGTGSAGSAIGGFNSAVGTYMDVLTPSANQTEFQIVPRGASADWVGSVDNISIREVLEWGWAWVFDGTDDLMATVSQPAVTEETLIVTKRLYALPASTRTAMAKAGTNTGVELYANSSVYNNSQIGTGTGYVYRSFSGAVATAVHSAVVTPTSRQIRVNGASVGVEAITFASAAATIKIGGGTAPFNGEIFAAAYCPTALSDAEMLIIERAQAQLGGIAI